MRILVCAPYTPYPAAGGGRADIWRRIEAFVENRHTVMLVHQYDPDGQLVPKPEHYVAMDKVVSARISYPVRRDGMSRLRQLSRAWREPWRVATASPTRAEAGLIRRAALDFRPDVIWLDGPWLGGVAGRLAQELHVPVAFRSHNIEHLYLKRQARATSRLRDRVAWGLTALGLKHYELRLMKASSRVFDISIDDMAYWKSKGIDHISWLPPLPETALVGRPRTSILNDVVFAGGLSLPNNIKGVRWLVEEVMPLVRLHRPDVSLTVVGSTPKPDLAEHLRSETAVQTAYNVDSVNPYIFGARVLVNPVWIGSGVQLKILDMLMTDTPIVSRSQGVRGLPPECAKQIEIQDTAEGFAAALLQSLEHPEVDTAARERSRRYFALEAIDEALREVPGLDASPKP